MVEKESRKKKLGFRNLKDMFAAVRAQEKAKDDDPDGETDGSQVSENSATEAEKGEDGANGSAVREEDDDDELSKEQ